MKKSFFLSCLLLAIVTVFQADAKTPKSLFVIIDGVPPDMIERLDLPTLQSVSAKGGYHRAYTGGEVGMYSETPTVSAIGYTNMLTGTWMNKHNVQGNEDMHPNYNYWSLFRIAKEQNRPVKTALFNGWAEGSRVLVGRGKPETNFVDIDLVVDSIENDTIRFPKQPLDRQIFDADSVLSVELVKAIEQEAPDMTWLLLWYTDEIAHHLGNGKQFDEYVVRTDELLAPVWKAIEKRERENDEDWLVVLTTDHGRIECGLWHGKQSARERTTWISTNQPTNSHFQSNGLAIVDINPTVCRFMGFDVPDEVAWEQDGMPFIGPVDISDMKTMLYDDEIVKLSWTPINPQAQVEVYASPSNNFKTGGKDEWIKVGEVAASDGTYAVNLTNLPPSAFYKFTLVTPNNHLNRWLYLYAHS